MDVCECDILDMQSLTKYKAMYRFIISVIDVSSIYLHLLPVITSAFLSLFHDSRRPVWVLTDKCKEFLNKHFMIFYVTKAFSFQFTEIPT